MHPELTRPQQMHSIRQLSSVAAARLPGRRVTLLRLRPLLPTRPPAAAAVRCLASKRGGEEDKSWSEIASEAADVAKDLARKVGSSISSAISAVVPSKEERAIKQREKEERRRREELFRPDLGGGLAGRLMGRALGKMVSSALGAVGEQMREAAEQVEEVQSRAQAMIEGDTRVQERLGGSVRCMAPISQSSMTRNINGRVSRVVSLIMPVMGSGRQTAQGIVQWTEGAAAAGEEELSVSVRLASGEVLRVGGGTGGSGGRTIDVEWRSVD